MNVFTLEDYLKLMKEAGLDASTHKLAEWLEEYDKSVRESERAKILEKSCYAVGKHCDDCQSKESCVEYRNYMAGYNKAIEDMGAEKKTASRIKLESLAEVIVNCCDTHEEINKLCIALLDANMKSGK